MATKEEFIRFPTDNFCTSILSLGVPFSGKTFVFLGVLKEWLKRKTFDEVHLVLPQFKNEMNGSYKWILDEYPDVHVYEEYHDSIAKSILDKQTKLADLQALGKLKTKFPKVFFAIDDATGQGTLFESSTLLKLITQNRHIQVHSWYLMHFDKGIIKPRIRQNMYFLLLYKVKEEFLKHCFKEYIQFDEFDNYNEFKEWWREYLQPQEYGCMIVAGKKAYSPDPALWFSDKK